MVHGMTYEEKMARLRAKAKHQTDAITQRHKREAQQRRVLSLAQVNSMIDKTEKKIERRAKLWESKGSAQPMEVAKPDSTTES